MPKAPRRTYKRKTMSRKRSAYPLSLSGPRRSIRDTTGAGLRVRRMARDGVLYSPSTGSFSMDNYDTGTTPGWVSGLTTPAVDGYSFANSYQFGLGCTFKLTDVPNSAEFTGLFNEYRIDRIAMRVSVVSCGPTDPTAACMASAYVAWDPNDGVAPPDTESMQQRDTTTLVDFLQGKPLTLLASPRPAQAIYSSALATSYGYSTRNNIWLDCTAPSNETPHYGLKFYFRNFVSFLNSGYALRFQPTYYMSFRRTR